MHTRFEDLTLGLEVEYVLGRSKGKTTAKNVRAVDESARTKEVRKHI